MRNLFALAALGIALVLPAAARADDPDVKEILKTADDATKDVKGVAYEAEFFGEGALADDLPHIKGKVKLKKPKAGMLGEMLGGATMPQMRIEGTVKRGSDEERHFKIATDGKTAYAIDDEHKTVTKGDMPEAARILNTGRTLMMLEYAHPTPFDDEIKGEAKYEGTKKIGDQECDVIYVVYAAQAGQDARWYFSKEDHLPRRVDRIRKRGEETGASVTVVTKLEVDPEFGKGAFRLKTPEGYKEKEFESDEEEEEQPQLLTVGKKVPDFELATPDGKKVSLKDLKGSVVVLDFWATWCGPCKMAMPGVQKLAEQFKDKPVKVFGVSCWERGGDPAKYMKEKSYTYGLLLKGDNIADSYKVKAIPTFYVIDTEGKIAHASMYTPGHEKELAEAIKKAMKDSDM